MQRISSDIENKINRDTVTGCICSCSGGFCFPYIVPEAQNNYVSIFETDERN
jgi:hypothetical protein